MQNRAQQPRSRFVGRRRLGDSAALLCTLLRQTQRDVSPFFFFCSATPPKAVLTESDGDSLGWKVCCISGRGLNSLSHFEQVDTVL